MEKRITAGDLKTALEAQREVLSESLDALKKISPYYEALNSVESHLLDAIGDLDEAIAMVVVYDDENDDTEVLPLKEALNIWMRL